CEPTHGALRRARWRPATRTRREGACSMRLAIGADQLGDVAAVPRMVRGLVEDLLDGGPACRLVAVQLTLGELLEQAAARLPERAGARIEALEQLVGEADHDLRHGFSIYRYCHVSRGGRTACAPHLRRRSARRRTLAPVRPSRPARPPAAPAARGSRRPARQGRPAARAAPT